MGLIEWVGRKKPLERGVGEVIGPTHHLRTLPAPKHQGLAVGQLRQRPWRRAIEIGFDLACRLRHRQGLFSGAALALWIDYAVRAFRNYAAPTPNAHLVLKSGANWNDPIESVGEQLEGWYWWSHGNELKIFLVCVQPIPEARISVFTTASDATWIEHHLTARSLVIEIKAKLSNAVTLIGISGPGPYAERQQQQGKEQIAVTLSKEEMEAVLEPRPSEYSWSRKIQRRVRDGAYKFLTILRVW